MAITDPDQTVPTIIRPPLLPNSRVAGEHECPDPEVEVMAVCLARMNSLTPQARARALSWLNSRLEETTEVLGG
ncbi:hypothetical protein [Allostreptomyces psammosilenae]|uniref:Uncharacterized protein YggL (DUF469 family) n=1 Tax=Allostreptomyces psammosilenae TaxID=1892865 RepID=A0A853A412_9ACTN|nr:hypothetical protein [Allostreptomyces psammosilenae]NYI08200.1 uncharacterized protein YggL (DUF469 family) [Allostreptomyces psammosilenae]